jgi:hypothetical protein
MLTVQTCSVLYPSAILQWTMSLSVSLATIPRGVLIDPDAGPWVEVFEAAEVEVACALCASRTLSPASKNPNQVKISGFQKIFSPNKWEKSLTQITAKNLFRVF